MAIFIEQILALNARLIISTPLMFISQFLQQKIRKADGILNFRKNLLNFFRIHLELYSKCPKKPAEVYLEMVSKAAAKCGGIKKTYD